MADGRSLDGSYSDYSPEEFRLKTTGRPQSDQSDPLNIQPSFLPQRFQSRTSRVPPDPLQYPPPEQHDHLVRSAPDTDNEPLRPNRMGLGLMRPGPSPGPGPAVTRARMMSPGVMRALSSDSLSYSTASESFTASASTSSRGWQCDRCSHHNGDPHNHVCAVCGTNRTTATRDTPPIGEGSGSVPTGPRRGFPLENVGELGPGGPSPECQPRRLSMPSLMSDNSLKPVNPRTRPTRVPSARSLNDDHLQQSNGSLNSSLYNASYRSVDCLSPMPALSEPSGTPYSLPISLSETERQQNGSVPSDDDDGSRDGRPSLLDMFLERNRSKEKLTSGSSLFSHSSKSTQRISNHKPLLRRPIHEVIEELPDINHAGALAAPTPFDRDDDEDGDASNSRTARNAARRGSMSSWMERSPSPGSPQPRDPVTQHQISPGLGMTTAALKDVSNSPFGLVPQCPSPTSPTASTSGSFRADDANLGQSPGGLHSPSPHGLSLMASTDLLAELAQQAHTILNQPEQPVHMPRAKAITNRTRLWIGLSSTLCLVSLILLGPILALFVFAPSDKVESSAGDDAVVVLP